MLSAYCPTLQIFRRNSSSEFLVADPINKVSLAFSDTTFCQHIRKSYRSRTSTDRMATVGSYLATRFEQIGLLHHFVVPGDYNLILLDRLLDNPKRTQIGCTNELNCSFAAEGYARANGIAACVVTFSVGAFSAFNGIGGAYAENLPVTATL